MTGTALYRLFNADGKLLYVGIADDLHRRWVQHARSKAWWPEVAKKTADWHDSRGDAEKAEVKAIEEELPLYNLMHRNALATPEGAAAMARIKLAHDAIEEAEHEGKRLVEEARVRFGTVINKLTADGDLRQDEVVALTGKTREYVRRLQVKARNKGEK